MVSIELLDEFKRQLKHLHKKYKASLLNDYSNLLDELKANPHIGIELGGGVHKVRMAITAKGKGKSGGARVITYVVADSGEDTSITLLSIYDKSEISSVSNEYIQSLLNQILK